MTAGHALTVAYDLKVAEAAEACSQAGIAFIPLAVESLWEGGTQLRWRR